MRNIKNVQWPQAFLLLVLGFAVGYIFSQLNSSDQQAVSASEIQQERLVEKQELNATKLALETTRTKVEILRELYDEAVNGKHTKTLP